MTRAGRQAVLPIAALAAAGWGCDVPFPETTRAECRVTALHERIQSSVRSQAVLVVIDPELGRVLDDLRREALLQALVGGVRTLVTGDRDADGERDFSTDEVLRVAVVTADGGEVLDAPPAPALPFPDARPLDEGFIEVWPGEDTTWDAWFVEAARARFAAALEAPVPPRATPLSAALTFAREHPELVDVGWSPMVVIVGGRDDEPVDLALWDAWSDAFGPTVWALAVVGGLLPSHLPPRGGLPDFDALLTRPGIEEDVRCEDEARVGVFPRHLVGLARDLSAAGGAISLSSLCAPGPDLLDPIVAWTTDSLRQSCLPRPLPTRLDGTVECRVEATLPASGRGSRCVDHGLRELGVVLDPLGRPRERCELPAVPRGAIASSPGFYYDDFSPDRVDTCGSTPYRLALTPITHLPGGTIHEWWCAQGTAECGLELAGEREPLDAGAD